LRFWHISFAGQIISDDSRSFLTAPSIVIPTKRFTKQIIILKELLMLKGSLMLKELFMLKAFLMKRSYRTDVWVLAAALSLLLIACGPAGGAEDEADAEATQAPAVADSQEDAVAPEEPAGEAADPAVEPVIGELEYIEIEAGEGPLAVPGDQVSVHYTGTLEDGTVFDSSVNRGVPFDFVLGRGEVIPGWDQGIALMRAGGKATLIIPPNLAYGSAGAGGSIPPNATLTFEVELVSISKPPVPVTVAEEDYETLSPGVFFYQVEEGDGEAVEAGDRISVHFSAWVKDGDFLTSSEDQGRPVIYTLGSEEIFLNDWDAGVIGTKVGMVTQFLITPEAESEAIPPGETLILEMELLQKLEAIARTEIDEADYITSDSGLQYYDIEVGEGEEAQLGNTVTVHYTGWLLDGESHFDSSLDRGEPAEFTLGIGQVIPGWDEGISGMQVGGKRQLLIPSELGFGEAGQGRIPPNSPVVFEVELIAIADS
jgi:peptidylprolyl isomerase